MGNGSFKSLLSLPRHLQPWTELLGGAWPAEAGPTPDESAVDMALQWVKPGEVSGLAIAMYCRPDGASNAEVLAACRDKKTNRARTLHLEGKMVFMKASIDGTLRYFADPVGTRPGPANAAPFIHLDDTNTFRDREGDNRTAGRLGSLAEWPREPTCPTARATQARAETTKASRYEAAHLFGKLSP